MLVLSKKLYKKHKHEWRKATPESNIYWIGWLMGEIGEVLDIIKKQGVSKIMKDKRTRKKMLEEITDCFMYLADILNRYRFTAEEFSQAYLTKMGYNLKRNYHRLKK